MDNATRRLGAIVATLPKRPIRIAGVSGSASDRRTGPTCMRSVAENDAVDVIIGDWMSEYNMASRGATVAADASADAFEPSFLEALTPALPAIQRNGIKCAVNAGASSTRRLAEIVQGICVNQGLDLKVAWVEGDEVITKIKAYVAAGDNAPINESTGATLTDWGFRPLYAQCYLGGFGIAAAFENGNDIVICGRVSDASPTIGAAAWWYGWSHAHLSELAGALIAGHCIECSSYITGGNFSGFKSLTSTKNLGFPIAVIYPNGEFDVTKSSGSDGAVTIDTCKSQLLYEIQGPWYYNSDVTADIQWIKIEPAGENIVHVSNIIGVLPPPTTKVGITALGGYMAEMHWFLVGLDIEAKARMVEEQVRQVIDVASLSHLSFTQHGSVPTNPTNQPSATVDLRIFAQAPAKDLLSPPRFLKPIADLIMAQYPGATFHLDIRQAFPLEYHEYWVTSMPQSDVKHRVHLHDGRTLDVRPPKLWQSFPSQQPSHDPVDPVELFAFGSTQYTPLGLVVHGRSGDKGTNANVGFWVQHEDEYAWLKSLLTIAKVKELLADEYKGARVDRFELPNIWAVHFLLHNHLDRGVSSTSSCDFLAKNVAEYLRCKVVAIPQKFLARGHV